MKIKSDIMIVKCSAAGECQNLQCPHRELHEQDELCLMKCYEVNRKTKCLEVNVDALKHLDPTDAAGEP